MKTICTLILSIIISSASYACSFSPYSFCEMTQYEGNVLYGRVVAHIPNGIRLEVFSALKGVETRDTITVWDGNDFICMDTMAIDANMLGQVGDTVVAILPLIDSIENNWDVIGDYRMPNYIYNTQLLAVSNDTVRGFIKGDHFAPIEYRVLQYPLNAFLQAWNVSTNCADIQVSISEVSTLAGVEVYPNPTTDNIVISNLPADATVELISIDGQHIGYVTLNDNRISTLHLAAGTYLLKINYQGETGFRRIVKL